MKIRYDAQGRILAVGDDSNDWGAPLLQIADHEAPADLAATFALGKYAVQQGRIVKAANGRFALPPAPAWLRAMEERAGTAPFAAVPAPAPTPGAAAKARVAPGKPAKASAKSAKSAKSARPAPRRKAAKKL
jgi:hypothetical protein